MGDSSTAKIKPLDWDESQAETPFGVYDFGRIGGAWTLRFNEVVIESGVESNFRRAAGAAKEAAKFHHESRILEALE